MIKISLVIFIINFLCTTALWGIEDNNMYTPPNFPSSLNSEDTTSNTKHSNWLIEKVAEETKKDSINNTKEEKASELSTNMLAESDTVFSNSNDSLIVFDIKEKYIEDTIEYTQFSPDPNKVVWMSLAFPGLGQIYNRKYWKLPIVYGGAAGIAYAISINNRHYTNYSRAYRDMLDSNPNTDSYLDVVPNGLPESQWESYLKSKQNNYRRYRDMSIIIGVAFYALTVVDAFVDASLAEFDVSPDISMKVRPKLDNQPNTVKPSIACAMQFNF